MMRNFARINNYWNKKAAWEDWEALAKTARQAGRADLVVKFQPAENAGWRKIDKATDALRAALEKEA